MNDKSVAHETVLEQLEIFGLSTYAARTFVALVTLGHGTAQDVSTTVSVPRTRVYDAIEELEQRGLATIEGESPQRFWPISPETAGTRFEREFTRHADVLRKALDSLESNPVSTEQRGIWTTDGHETVSRRIQRLIHTAEEEIIFTSSESLLDPGVIQALDEAQDDGVRIKLGEMEAPTKSDISDVLSDAASEVSLWDAENRPTGRLVIVDTEQILISTVVPDGDLSEQHSGAATNPIKENTEIAIWGKGPDNNVISVLRVLVG